MKKMMKTKLKSHHHGVLFLSIIFLVLAIVIGIAIMQAPHKYDRNTTIADEEELTAQPTAVPVTTIPAQHSIYMYSVARGLKYHEDPNFVCTSGDATNIYGSQGLIGIWCEY